MNISKFYLTASSITVTKGIVDLHGGKISVSSEGEGHGSTFTVELPVYKVLNPQPQHSSLMSSGEAPMIPSLRASIDGKLLKLNAAFNAL